MIYGCIGEKLSHSFSKEIHNKLFDYEYEICEVAREKLCDFMQKRDFKAINVTIPYKEDVIPHLYKISETAKAIGAVNTIVNCDGKLFGYNTDFSGMCALIEKNKISLEGKKVLVLGSGGTAKTAFAVATHLKAKSVLKVSRKQNEGCITYEQMYENHTDADVLINTTPCGMYPNPEGVAIDIDKFPSLEAVVDAVYNPLRSRLICLAKQKGIKATGGLYMLVAQAAHAAELFTGQKVSSQKIDEVFSSIMLEKENVVLIGMPSCGKSTIGKIVADKLNMDFADSDEAIVKKTGISIPEIFEKYGESEFRKKESEVISELSKKQNTVIATGGGAVLNVENTLRLSQNGRIYFIDRALSSLLATEDRPLSSSRDALLKRYNERYDIYKNACHYHLKAGDLAEENAEKIIEEFKNEASCC